MNPLLTFVHISDTHIGPKPDFTKYDRSPFAHLVALVDVINAMPVQPDFIVHTGDLSHDRSPESYEVAAPLFARFNPPVYYVNGNHDEAGMLRKYMGAPANSDSYSNVARLVYTFDVKGEHFLVLDSLGMVDPQGHIDEAQLAWLRAQCTPDGPPLTVFIHHPLFPLHAPWANANMLVDNGEAVHAALLPARERLRGVFGGHLHRSCQYARDGIIYTSVGSSFVQFGWPSADEHPLVDEGHPPTYNVVRCFEGYVLVTQQVFTVM